MNKRVRKVFAGKIELGQLSHRARVVFRDSFGHPKYIYLPKISKWTDADGKSVSVAVELLPPRKEKKRK